MKELLKKGSEAYYRNMLDTFKGYMAHKFSLKLVKFFKDRSIKELVYLQLKCTSKGIHEPERALAALTNEINRRTQFNFLMINSVAVVVAIVAVIVALFKN